MDKQIHTHPRSTLEVPPELKKAQFVNVGSVMSSYPMVLLPLEVGTDREGWTCIEKSLNASVKGIAKNLIKSSHLS